MEILRYYKEILHFIFPFAQQDTKASKFKIDEAKDAWILVSSMVLILKGYPA